MAKWCRSQAYLYKERDPAFWTDSAKITRTRFGNDSETDLLAQRTRETPFSSEALICTRCWSQIRCTQKLRNDGDYLRSRVPHRSNNFCDRSWETVYIVQIRKWLSYSLYCFVHRPTYIKRNSISIILTFVIQNTLSVGLAWVSCLADKTPATRCGTKHTHVFDDSVVASLSNQSLLLFDLLGAFFKRIDRNSW